VPPSLRPALFDSDAFERMFLAGAFKGRRVELRGGVIVEMNPIYTSHAFVRGKVKRRLEDALAVIRPDLTVLDEVSIKGADFYPTADIVAFRFDGADRAIRPHEVALVVEVAVSSRDDDLGDKKQRYQAIGVPEYWVIDVHGRALHRFALRDAVLETTPACAYGEAWGSLTIPGLSIASEGLG
jgi:Uma2 family endonuclease